MRTGLTVWDRSAALSALVPVASSALVMVVVVVGAGRVEVVLGADAPLPGWVTSRVSDPADPEDRIRFTEEVPGLDAAGLVGVLAEFRSARRVRVEPR